MTITLATLPQATAQEVYSQVRKHLLTQKIKSMSEERKGYVYHGPDGLKCAAGCLVHEKEYVAEMEGYSWDQLVEHGFVPNKYQGLILNLQAIHDRHEAAYWEHHLNKLAADFNLEPK